MPGGPRGSHSERLTVVWGLSVLQGVNIQKARPTPCWPCPRSGQPSVTLGIDNVPLMLVGAAVMLALKKPISVTRKETGGLSLDLPFGGDGGASYALQERVRRGAAAEVGQELRAGTGAASCGHAAVDCRGAAASMPTGAAAQSPYCSQAALQAPYV